MSPDSGPDPGRWSRVEAALDRLLEVPPEERAGALAKLEPAVAREVEELLDEVDRRGPLDRDLATDWLEGTSEPLAEPAHAGQRFGAWEVIRRLGAGGMGVVYLARRADGEYEQRAALKVLRRDVRLPRRMDRLTTERQILARLDHPAIARLLDGGVGPDGAPYLVMEWVDGRPIDDYAEQRGLSVEERLDLFRTVCAAVETAHRKLVLHRDLKPSNVLVRDDGRVKLLDFGVAKLLGEGGAPMDQTRGAPGTPSYAAPEQIRGEPVGLAVDVWGLGVLLHRLLTGVHPFSRPGATAFAVQSRILAADPDPPSCMVLGRRDDLPEPARRRLAHRLSGDLDAIVLRALAERPGDRYGTVGELAADLDRHRRAEPVRARRGTVAYRARRFVRRHRWSLATVALVVALVAALGGVTLRHLGVTSRQAQEIDRQRRHAEAATTFLVDVFDLSEGGEPVAVERRAARTLLDRGVAQVRADPAVPPSLRGTLLRTAGRTYFSLGLLDPARSVLREAAALHAGADGTGGAGDLAATLLALSVVETYDLRWDAAAEHLEDALAAVSEAGEGDALDGQRGALLSQFAYVERQRGDLERGEALARRALALAEDAGEPDVRDRAEAVLASILARRGRYSAAEERYRAVLDRQVRRRGPNAYEAARTFNDLAFLLRQQDRLGEAEALYRRSLAILDRRFPEGHPDQLMLLQNLAGVHYLQGRVGELRHTLRRRVEIARALYPRGWMLNNALLGLSRVEIEQGDCAAALPLLAEAEAVPVDAADPASRSGHRVARLLRATCLLVEGETAAGRGLLEQVVPDLPSEGGMDFFANLRRLASDQLAAAGLDVEAHRVLPGSVPADP